MTAVGKSSDAVPSHMLSPATQVDSCTETCWSPVNVCLLVQVGWIMQTIAIFGLPYNPEYYFTRVGTAFFRIFACLPWCPLIKGTLDLAAATSSEKDPGKFQPWVL